MRKYARYTYSSGIIHEGHEDCGRAELGDVLEEVEAHFVVVRRSEVDHRRDGQEHPGSC